MRRWIFFIIIMIIFHSCSKENYCSGNCANIHFSGRIIDTATGEGVANVPLQLFWNTSGFGLLTNRTKITGSRTNKDGYFDFTVTLDKNRFNDYYLSIAASLPSSYLQSGDFAYLSNYTPDVTDINLTAFPKANLTVKLIKSQPDSLIYFQFSYYFSPYGATGLFVGEPSVDTVFQVETAANIYTQFHWTKYYGIGQYKDFSDSVICSAKHENVFTLNY